MCNTPKYKIYSRNTSVDGSIEKNNFYSQGAYIKYVGA